MPRGDGLIHGTLGGYTNYRCRCQPCRDAYAAYSRDWRARNPERAKAISQRNSRTPSRIASIKAWRLANRDRTRATTRRRVYGLDQAGFDALMEAQGGVCAICGRQGHPLHVDHDHETGDVRGLLCGRCNSALGLLGDSIEQAQKAVDYLRDASSSRI